MPNIYNTTTDSTQPITTFDELKSAMPTVPENPSIWALDDLPGYTVQVVYGSPDRHHAEVKVITVDGIDRDLFDNFKAATDRFLAIARHAF